MVPFMELGPRRMSTAARRAQLLKFGRRHFAEHGYDAMPMDAIADRAGVSKGLLYHYFGNQRAFYMETVRAVTDELIAITEPPPGQPFEQAFHTMVTSFVDYVQEHGAIYTALVRGGLGSDAEVNELLDRVRFASMNRIFALLGIDQPSSFDHLALYGWVSLVENTSAEWIGAAGVSPPQLVGLFVTTFEPVLDVLRKGCSHG